MASSRYINKWLPKQTGVSGYLFDSWKRGNESSAPMCEKNKTFFQSDATHSGFVSMVMVERDAFRFSWIISAFLISNGTKGGFRFGKKYDHGERSRGLFGGVHTNTVYYLVKLNEIPYLKLCNRILFTKDSIDLWMQDQANAKNVSSRSLM